MVTAEGVIEPRITDGVLTGTTKGLLGIQTIVPAILRDPIVRVLIWTPEGKVLYSDHTDLIGGTFLLSEAAQQSLDTEQVTAGGTTSRPTQTPPAHVSSGAQALPHAPQCDSSVLTSTHAPEQLRSPALHVDAQTRSLHTSPAPQTVPLAAFVHADTDAEGWHFWQGLPGFDSPVR